MTQEMKYRYELVKRDGIALIPIRGIDDEEAELIFASNYNMHKFNYVIRKYKELELNYEDYFRTIERYNDLFKRHLKGKTIGYDYKEKSFIDINRAYNNYVASIKSFVDLCEEKIKKHFGYGSNEHIQFKKKLSHYYDNVLGYKLLIRTRDLVLHSDFAIQQITYLNEREKIEKISFERDSLLANETLKKKLKNDIKDFPKFFDVETYVKQVQPLMKDILVNFAKTVQPYYIDSANHLLEVSVELDSKDIGVNRANFVEPNRIVHNDTKLIPVDMAEHFHELINN